MEKNKSKKAAQSETIETVDPKTNIGHRCQVLPFNTPEWCSGVITGVTTDKRTNQVFYQIRIEDGRKIVKAVNSKCLKVLEELVPTQVRAKKEAWTEDGASTAIDAVAGNIGKMVEFTKADASEPLTGRIIGVIADKRVSTTLYKISVDGKLIYKVTTAADLKIAETFDEDGQKLNSEFLKRREKAAAKAAKTPEEEIARLEAEVTKALEAVVKAQKRVKKAQAELEAAKTAKLEDLEA